MALRSTARFAHHSTQRQICRALTTCCIPRSNHLLLRHLPASKVHHSGSQFYIPKILYNKSAGHGYTYVLDETPLEVDELDNAYGDEEVAERMSNLDEEGLKKLKAVKLLHYIASYEGSLVPDEEDMTDRRWLELMDIRSDAKRRKTLKYWRKIDIATAKLKGKKELQKKWLEEQEYTYANKLFIRIQKTTVNRVNNGNLAWAMQFGRVVVFDCSWEDSMTNREITNTVEQLNITIGEHRKNYDPWHMVFCGFNYKSRFFIQFFKSMGSAVNHLPITITEKSYLDLFPDRIQDLVYLSPNSPHALKKDHINNIYIIGCIVDTGRQDHLSLGRAKEQKLRSARFPLERLTWCNGRKSLSLPVVGKVLHNFMDTNDWDRAFKHIPLNKLKYSKMMVKSMVELANSGAKLRPAQKALLNKFHLIEGATRLHHEEDLKGSEEEIKKRKKAIEDFW